MLPARVLPGRALAPIRMGLIDRSARAVSWATSPLPASCPTTSSVKSRGCATSARACQRRLALLFACQGAAAGSQRRADADAAAEPALASPNFGRRPSPSMAPWPATDRIREEVDRCRHMALLSRPGRVHHDQAPRTQHGGGGGGIRWQHARVRLRGARGQAGSRSTCWPTLLQVLLLLAVVLPVRVLAVALGTYQPALDWAPSRSALPRREPLRAWIHAGALPLEVRAARYDVRRRASLPMPTPPGQGWVVGGLFSLESSLPPPKPPAPGQPAPYRMVRRDWGRAGTRELWGDREARTGTRVGRALGCWCEQRCVPAHGGTLAPGTCRCGGARAHEYGYKEAGLPSRPRPSLAQPGPAQPSPSAAQRGSAQSVSASRGAKRRAAGR